MLLRVNSVINDVSSELSTIEGQINSAAGFASDLPFIGQQLASDLNPAKLFQPINSELNALENTINTDLSNSATLLTTLESDIVSALSSVNLLPGTPGNDVTIDYVANGQQATVGPGTTGDLTNVTQLELDLILGQSVTDTYPVGTDIGLPGLGLKLQPGSTINGTIGWSFDLGLGLSQANGPYLVAGNASNNGSPVNFNVSFTLGNNFQAVGTMGFLEALLTEPNEPNPAAHTGVTGNIVRRAHWRNRRHRSQRRHADQPVGHFETERRPQFLADDKVGPAIGLRRAIHAKPGCLH